MGLQNDTSTSVIEADTQNSVGTQFGVSATDKVGFFGATPVVQQSGASQTIITDTSGGTAHADTGLQALTSTYNSTLIANAISTLANGLIKVQTDLKTYGLSKGGA